MRFVNRCEARQLVEQTLAVESENERWEFDKRGGDMIDSFYQWNLIIQWGTQAILMLSSICDNEKQLSRCLSQGEKKRKKEKKTPLTPSQMTDLLPAYQ